MSTGAARHALLAVDAPEDVDRLRAWLLARGFQPHVFIDIESALRAVDANAAALVVLDADLEHPSFVDALRAASEALAPWRGRLVAVGAAAEPSWMAACLASGADHYLVKPLTEDALTGCLAGR